MQEVEWVGVMNVAFPGTFMLQRWTPRRRSVLREDKEMTTNRQHPWIIRQARREDVPVIVELLANDPLGKTREMIQDPVAEGYLQAFDAITKDPNQFLAVMEQDGVVIGTLQLTFIPGLSRRGSWRAEIEAVRIHEHYRGRGLGEAFIQWAIAQAKERNCRVVQLTSDKTRIDAHRFYQNLGFVASHEGMKLLLA